MQRRCIVALVVLITCNCVAHAQSSFQEAAKKLFDSLSPEQRKAALLAFDSPERNKQLFPPAKRPGVVLQDLDAGQRKMAINLVRQFTSDYGFEKAEAITKQGAPGGWNRFYLTFFGEPGDKKNWAWRIAEHHLTIVHAEYEDGQLRSIGPILLGANPPVLWDDEEAKMIELYGTLSPAERAKAVREGKADSTAPLGDAGITVGDLSTEAKAKVKEVFDIRLKFFAPESAERVKKMVEMQGGLDALKIAYWGEATKKCADGGKWDFKLGGDRFLCDYENTRGHIHLSIKGEAESQKNIAAPNATLKVRG